MIKRYHPGVYLKEALEAMDMTAKEFSIRTGISERSLSSFMAGKTGISFELASKLGSFFGNSPSVWINLQTSYDTYLAEEKAKAEVDNDYKLISGFKKYFASFFGMATAEGHGDFVEKVRKLASVNSINLLRTDERELIPAYHKEQKGNAKIDHFVFNLYFSIALTAARKIETKPFDKDAFLKILSGIRKLTLKEPEEFIGELVERFRACGVAFVYLPYMKNLELYGAAKWLSPEKAMIVVSNRGKQADVFWFTLLHEAGHLLNKSRRDPSVLCDVNEVQSDSFAREQIVSEDEYKDFVMNSRCLFQDIERFAKEKDFSPCLLEGMIRHDKPKNFCELKNSKFYEFDVLQKAYATSFQKVSRSCLPKNL